MEEKTINNKIYVVLGIADISDAFEDAHVIVNPKVAFTSEEEADKYIKERDGSTLLDTNVYAKAVKENLVCLSVELCESGGEINK